VNIPSNIITLIAGIALTLISLWYGQNHNLLPVAASPEAEQVDGIFNFMMTIATGLFLLIQGVLVFVIIKFRRKKGDNTDGPPLEGNVPLEIVWTAIPTIIVFILAIYSFEVYNNMGGLDPMASGDMGTQKMAHHHHNSSYGHKLVAMNSDPSQVALGLGVSPEEENKIPLNIGVKGIQYAWLFTYKDTGIVSGEIHLPVNKLVQLNIEAGDVLHAFWLPEFRIKQDAIPGRTTQLIFTANRIGEYPVICAELCGAYHGGMKTKLYVQTQEDYDKWVRENAPAQVAAIDKEQTLAVNPVNLSDGEFLAPYAKEMGVEKEAIAQLHQE
jgi:cytochrome c oxidase subunit II